MQVQAGDGRDSREGPPGGTSASWTGCGGRTKDLTPATAGDSGTRIKACTAVFCQGWGATWSSAGWCRCRLGAVMTAVKLQAMSPASRASSLPLTTRWEGTRSTSRGRAPKGVLMASLCPGSFSQLRFEVLWCRHLTASHSGCKWLACRCAFMVMVCRVCRLCAVHQVLGVQGDASQAHSCQGGC